MLDFEQIREQYPKNLQRFERAILREYLQYKVLQAIHHRVLWYKDSMGSSGGRLAHADTAKCARVAAVSSLMRVSRKPTSVGCPPGNGEPVV